MALTKVKLIADGVITSANLDASHGITTSDIGEGSNLYYTDSRVSSYLSTNGFATQTDIVAAITDSAPVTLDTLNELAAALGDDPNFATTTATSLGLKAPLASPSFTGNATFAGNVTTESIFQVYSTGASAVIGAIGNTANDVNIYSTTTGHNGLRMHINGILPTDNTGTIIDNDADLGDPGYRFKTLYLGGNANLGASNYLRFTAAASGSDASVLFGNTSGTGGSLTFKRNSDASTILRLDADGNVGIGTTSPQVPLQIGTHLTTAPADTGLCVSNRKSIRINDADGSYNFGVYIKQNYSGSSYLILGTRHNGTDTDGLVVKDGNVGIGATSPDETLHLKLTTGDPRIKLETGGGGDPGIIFQSANNRTGEMFFQDGSTSARFSYDHAAEAFKMYAHNQTVVDFYVSETSAYLPSQSFGIGVTSPGTKLDVAGSGKFQPGIADGDALVTIAQTNSNAYVHAGIKINAGNTNPFYIYQSGSSNTLRFNYNSLADAGGQLVITDSGNVGIGETEPASKLHITKNAGASTTAEILRLDCGETNHQSGKGGKIVFRDISVYSDTATIEAVRVGASSASELKFTTRGTTRSVISRDGYTKMANSGNFFSISGSYHEMNQSVANEWSYILHNSSNSPYGMYIKYSGASPNNTQEVIYFADTTQQRFYVTSAGAVYGNGTYGTISDQKLKENIVDATPKLDDINKLKVRNFNFKDKPEEKHIGFIAQEFEEVFPSMIETNQDKDDDNNLIEDSYTKTIKSSVLIPMLVKAIQELKADNDNLRERIQTLENQ